MTEKLILKGSNPTSIGYNPTGAELYEYDGFNRLTRAYVDGEETTYTYRADGLCNTKTTSEGTTTHVWDGQNIAADLKNGAVDTRYTRGINLIKSDNASAGQKYYLYNGHGDVVQLANNSSAISWNYDYDAFGNERQIAGQDASLDTNPFRYSGEYFDKETGTIYLRSRYYNPCVGRFITEDSYLGDITDPLSLNLYTYCYNNPLRFFDPTGHYTEEEAEELRNGLKSDNWLDKAKAVTKGASISWRDRYNNAKNSYINAVIPRDREAAETTFDMSMGYLGGEMTAGLINSTGRMLKGAAKVVSAKPLYRVMGEGEDKEQHTLPIHTLKMLIQQSLDWLYRKNLSIQWNLK